ncbi:desiccation protectant protein Lea14 homolog [Zingiber officinale]|uniref:desiccation protectant protein Lea14 homolog n=1 Tax=Zingiber officinale TaxID=94328 RepID=UPI001C4C8A8F|nr:desiccation protectant protein Lea14 homolog [Zingiber officinale]
MASLFDKAKEFVAEKIAGVPKPEASLAAVSIKSFSRNSFLFHSDVAVQNPYTRPIPICEVSFSLKSAGREIASGRIPDPGSLTANGETKLEVPVKVPYDFMISLLKDVGRDWDIDYQLDVGLIVDLPIVGDLTIPLSAKGEIKLPTVSDLFKRGGDGSDD